MGFYNEYILVYAGCMYVIDDYLYFVVIVGAYYYFNYIRNIYISTPGPDDLSSSYISMVSDYYFFLRVNRV